MNTFQWNHSTTIANHSCPGYSDVWRFCNNDFIFVMSTCRFFIRPGRGQGAGSLAAIPVSMVSSLRRAAPQRPVAKQHGGMPSTRAQNLRVYWLARQILPIGTGSRYIALPKRICSPLLPTPLLPKICSLGKPQLNTDAHELAERQFCSSSNHTSLSSSIN